MSVIAITSGGESKHRVPSQVYLLPKLSDSFDCCSVFGLRRRESAWFWLSTCPGGDSGVPLFTIQHGLAYDLRDKAFVVDSGIPDMLLGTYHVITHRGDGQGAKLEIGFGEVGVSREIDALSTFSEFSALRGIRTVEGRKIGKDRWGHVKAVTDGGWLNSLGRRCGYRASPVREAALWDKIIDSACLLPQPNS